MARGNEILRIKALLNRAGHKSTPVEEARTCAVMAAQLMFKGGYDIVVKQSDDFEPSIRPDADPYEDLVNRETDNWKDVQTFRITVSKGVGTCIACGKRIEKGVPTAEVYRKGVTHFSCKSYWVTSVAP